MIPCVTLRCLTMGIYTCTLQCGYTSCVRQESSLDKTHQTNIFIAHYSLLWQPLLHVYMKLFSRCTKLYINTGIKPVPNCSDRVLNSYAIIIILSNLCISHHTFVTVISTHTLPNKSAWRIPWSSDDVLILHAPDTPHWSGRQVNHLDTLTLWINIQ